MTVKLGDRSVGAPEEGLRKLGKRGATGEDEGCPEGGGGGCGGDGAKKGEEEGTPQGETNGGPSSGIPASPPASSSSGPPPAAPGHDQHHFLRSSVRPQSKRLRKDPQASCAAASSGTGSGGGSTAPTGKGKGADNGGTSSGNSSGFPSSTPAGNSKSGSRNLSTSTGEKEEGKKHGKDFEAIQNNIALKYKKKSKPASMVKNKEQVRHFYYRTWHKISKYIDFDNGEHIPERLAWLLWTMMQQAGVLCLDGQLCFLKG
ncbi:hypothetical protein E2320_012069 [Naja naja]|nr:hypothetical protein E2320_012069 [Naja naja]